MFCPVSIGALLVEIRQPTAGDLYWKEILLEYELSSYILVLKEEYPCSRWV